MPGPEAPARLPRVVVLGGGVAGITTAFELSQPGWRHKYESITVYQYGWRLGGKGASGRGRHGRIEEHGLHIWLGFYENAFRMMRECYEELGRDASSPISSVDEAFERASLFIVQEPRGDSWLQWMAEFSETDEVLGSGEKTIPPLWELMLRALRLAVSFDADAKLTAADLGAAVGVSMAASPSGRATPGVALAPAPRPLLRQMSAWIREVYLDIWYLVSDARQVELGAALVLAEYMPSDPALHDPADRNLLRELVESASHKLHDLKRRPDELSDQARREWYLTDILVAAFRGLLCDGVLDHPDGLDAIDHYDFADWLVRHGASAESAHCGMVTTLMYDLPFAYRNGDPRSPAIGAGTAMRGAIRTLFTYTGAIAWKMRAGMGDIVFAPMYEVLDRRGVRFEFFHRVESLHPSADGHRVGSVVLSRQAALRHPRTGYRPLVTIKGLPCWPNEPIADQLATPVTAEDVESFWSTAPPAGRPVTLHDQVDFDQLVLAIPVGAHPYICAELIKHNPRWQAMADHVATVYTQAFQVWLKPDMDELGCTWPQATVGGYYEPFDTYSDMHQLIEREEWPDAMVKSIAYFCNTMPTPTGLPSRHDTDLPKRAAAQVKANAVAFLRDAMAPLWPSGVQRYPTEFRWDLLVDEDEKAGPERFDSQFWRANVDPSERYVLSLPGTSRYRLAPDETGYENLVFAGDWTRCGLNSGCVESAVISGRLAAATVGARPPRHPIIGCARGARHVF